MVFIGALRALVGSFMGTFFVVLVLILLDQLPFRIGCRRPPLELDRRLAWRRWRRQVEHLVGCFQSAARRPPRGYQGQILCRAERVDGLAPNDLMSRRVALGLPVAGGRVSLAAHGFPSNEIANLCLRHPRLAQHLLRMLAEARRQQAHSAGRLGEIHRHRRHHHPPF